MKIAILFGLIFAAATVGAQTADVIELSHDDAALAQQAWDTLQKAQVQWNDVQRAMGKKYLPNTESSCVLTDPGIGGPITDELATCSRGEGWEDGFEFSKDFRFIVPKHKTAPAK